MQLRIFTKCVTHKLAEMVTQNKKAFLNNKGKTKKAGSKNQRYTPTILVTWNMFLI